MPIADSAYVGPNDAYNYCTEHNIQTILSLKPLLRNCCNRYSRWFEILIKYSLQAL